MEPMLPKLVLLLSLSIFAQVFLKAKIMQTRSIVTLFLVVAFLFGNPAFASKGAANQRKRVGNPKVVRSLSKPAKSRTAPKQTMSEQMKMNPKMKMQ